ncbi:hypothetical protein Mgra_00004034 [Meloidogyne graminicola]|uniref:Granulins domain-containing protein n=1 Tax=Meloidogyne graminicola TaxID=189291 RepID=A0A8S9ZTE2_9BILA|nr:hypothetical protein Mgra_00004034 [Meloidogyne graminicola]
MKKLKNINYLFIYSLFIFSFVQSNEEEEIICPDLESKCPNGTTCCTLDTGVFGCCPLPNAVCCSDHLHCCPENSHCDIEHQLCLHTNKDGIKISLPLMNKLSAKIIKQEVICPDKNILVQNIILVVLLDYGCCPAENAVCCSDHLHCCPHGTECDIIESRCVISNFQKEKIKEFPQLSIQTKKHRPKGKMIKAQIMKSSTHFCNSWITSSCSAINKWFILFNKLLANCNGQFNEKELIKCIINTIYNKCILTEINYKGQKDYLMFPFPKICPDKTICPSTDDTCCPRNDNGIIVYDCCSIKKANCCSDRTCCPYGYSCIDSFNDGSSKCRRMKTSELIAQLIFKKEYLFEYKSVIYFPKKLTSLHKIPQICSTGIPIETTRTGSG